ncbi:MAG: transposase [Myxococcales bacterium]|nr:transposase [Myxococcales bacterium]
MLVGWREDSVVDQRAHFVLRVRQEGAEVAATCREFGISRKTGHKWLKRYDEDGLSALEDESRAPRSQPHKTPEELVQPIVATRRRYPTWGPKKIRAMLIRQHPDVAWPAASTVGEILNREGLVTPRKRRRRTPRYGEPLAKAVAPNKLWSVDFKGQFQLGDGTMCYPLTVTDNYSRMLLGCYALPSTATPGARGAMERVFADWGIPEAIRSDNGSPFASRGILGLSRLSAWWVGMGVKHERIRPGKPQENGRHERMHLTLKQDEAYRDCRRLQDLREWSDDKELQVLFRAARACDSAGARIRVAARFGVGSDSFSGREDGMQCRDTAAVDPAV